MVFCSQIYGCDFSICKTVFQISLSIAAKSKLVLWGNRVKNILLKLQLQSFWDNKCAGLLKSEMKEMILCSMYRMERQKWKSDLVKMTKLRTYITFKQSFEQEVYTNQVSCRAHRSVFARLRGGSAPLEIERGRYQGVPAEQRLYKLCRDEVENEIHF